MYNHLESQKVHRQMDRCKDRWIDRQEYYQKMQIQYFLNKYLINKNRQIFTIYVYIYLDSDLIWRTLVNQCKKILCRKELYQTVKITLLFVENFSILIGMVVVNKKVNKKVLKISVTQHIFSTCWNDMKDTRFCKRIGRNRVLCSTNQTTKLHM